ncbi:tetratricopeptide repeat protein [Streptosporangium sp. NPDC002544]|uniref:tetratricopeptide repeat protein n=1 Tax=Streptosporangium sp. NPDC002544 TaxID=3154538 RepID=UPI003328F654
MNERLIVILTALDLEYQAVRKHLADLQIHRHPAGTRFEVGRLADGNCRVALGLVGKGNQPAAVLAERAIAQFAPSAVLFVGVAGALWPDIGLGDLVVATHVYAYHGGTSEDDGFKARPRVWEASHETDQIAHHLYRSETWVRRLPKGAAVPKVRFGPIAAGEVVQDSAISAHAQWVRQTYNDALAIEMEAAGVAQAAHHNRSLPMAVVRGISDRADGTKTNTDDADWQPRAVANAAAFATAFAQELAQEPHRTPPADAAVGKAQGAPVTERVTSIARDNAHVGIQAGHIHGNISISTVLSSDVSARMHEHIKQMEAAPPLPATQTAPCLPRELRLLFGRETEIAEGRRLLEKSDGNNKPALLVTGPPGIGKSAVALRLSRLVADVYPDGQFHVDLALSASGQHSADLVLALLHTLHPGDGPPPESRAHRIAMLRGTLSCSRVLLLIDDIVSEEALLEILQMDGPFALVCTSRAKFSGLTGLVHLIELGPLPHQHSEELVRAIAGPTRLTNEQASTLAEACAGHPLALHIAAAHLARRPKVSVDRFLDDIASPDRGLRALRAGQTALEPVLERSFAALSSEQAELFTRLGILPHMSVTPDVAAASTTSPTELDDVRVDAVTELLDSLFELSLIEQIDEDRFVFHEILHRFARLKSASTATELRETVIGQTCLVLAARTQSATESIGFVDKEAKVSAQHNADALRVLNADRPGAVAMTELAQQHQVWGPLVLLASVLTASLWHGSHWNDLDRIYRCVLEAGSQSNNPEWIGTALHNLGMAAARLGESERAAELFQRSAETAHEASNPYLMHLAQLSLGTLLINLGRARDAVPYLRNGLPFWRTIKDYRVLAQALGNLGQAHLALGQLRRAEQYLHNSKNLSRPGSSADLWNRDVIAALLRRTGRLAEAAQEASLDIERARAVGSREWEAKALMELAETPMEERPDSAPVQPLETALAIYRDTNDVQGQVRALFRLGSQAAERADIYQAVEHLEECANIAAGIGDYEHAARALSYLGSYHGGVGHLDEAETYFANARDMARHLGNPIVFAETLQRNADYLWHLGRIGEAINHLSEAVRLLEATEDKRALAQVRAGLGEALVVAGRWQEGVQALESIVSVLSDDASPATRAQASRALAILYSRRGLHREAMSRITKALDQCEQSGDKSAILQCRMALANVYARSGERTKALDQYNKAAELALERKDLHVLLTAHTMAAMCRLQGDEAEKDKAIAVIAKLMPLTKQLRMQSLEAALRNNVGAYHAESNDHEKAINEFRETLTLVDQIDDNTLRATCLLNLARSYRALGDVDKARSHAREAFALHQQFSNWSKAGDALLLLAGLYQDAAPDPEELKLNELLGDGQQLDHRVLEAIRSRPHPFDYRPVIKDGREASMSATIADRRKINVSDAVRQELTGIDIEQLTAHLGNSRQTCVACDLLIDETGEAELLLLHHRKLNQLTVRLTHPHCAASTVIYLKERTLKEPKVIFEVECILFGGDKAGIIADCYGGWGVHEDGRLEDLVLERYREAGFINLQTMLQLDNGQSLDLRDIPSVTSSGVQARLEKNNLSITGPHGQLLHRMPLNFLPRWYQQANEGSLTVIVGRNLQGMAAEDPSYLVRAMALSRTIGGAVPLTVVRPSRNSPCPCGIRAGRKFKHCCGRSSALK